MLDCKPILECLFSKTMNQLCSGSPGMKYDMSSYTKYSLSCLSVKSEYYSLINTDCRGAIRGEARLYAYVRGSSPVFEWKLLCGVW